jgi:hypothetical protein
MQRLAPSRIAAMHARPSVVNAFAMFEIRRLIVTIGASD